MTNLRQIFLPVCIAATVFVLPVQAADCSKLSGCSAKQCELDAQIELARKEASMRKLATLKELRSESARCTDTPAADKKQ